MLTLSVERQLWRKLAGGNRLGTVIRPFDLPAPKLSLKVQAYCRTCGDEVDVRSTRTRPVALAHGRRLQGEFKIIAAIRERPVIEKILSHLGLAPQPPPKGRVREAGLHFAA